MKQASCTTHDPNIPESFENKQEPIQLKRLRGATDEQTKAWAEHTWALSREGRSGQKANFTVGKKQRPVHIMRLRGTTDEQTKAWADHAWALSREGKSGQKPTFTVEKKAYVMGFVKAAQAAGLSVGQAVDLLYQAGNLH